MSNQYTSCYVIAQRFKQLYFPPPPRKTFQPNRAYGGHVADCPHAISSKFIDVGHHCAPTEFNTTYNVILAKQTTDPSLYRMKLIHGHVIMYSDLFSIL